MRGRQAVGEAWPRLSLFGDTVSDLRVVKWARRGRTRRENEQQHRLMIVAYEPRHDSTSLRFFRHALMPAHSRPDILDINVEDDDVGTYLRTYSNSTTETKNTSWQCQLSPHL
jgi:hypothetical protein